MKSYDPNPPDLRYGTGFEKRGYNGEGYNLKGEDADLYDLIYHNRHKRTQ